MNQDTSLFHGRDIYENVNPRIAQLYAGEAVVLDIGCGSGALGAWIKKVNPQAEVHGIDISPEAAAFAEQRLDRVWCLDLDNAPLPQQALKYDLIILGDVLEHLKRPDLFLSSICGRLAPQGSVIVSVPNIANYSIRLRMFFGRFEYTETGIMDRSHLRFFTWQSVTDLFAHCGLLVTDWGVISRFPAWLAKPLKGAMAVQFIFKLRKKG